MANQGSFYHRQAFNISNGNLINIKTNCPIAEKTNLIISNNTEDQQRYIDQFSTQISSSEDVETLLNHVNWRMFVYSCERASEDFAYSDYELQNNCSNSSCSFTDSLDDLFFFSLECGNNSCTTYLNSSLITHWYIFLLLGFLALLGNAIVICDKIKSLRKIQNKHKEIHIYHALVFNLALADVLMGVYLTAIAFEIRHKVAGGTYFSKHSLCNALAVMNALSSQVSITTLFIISFYRLVSVIKPYKKQHFRVVLLLIVLIWIVWLVIAFLPLIPMEPFATTFTIGLARDLKYEKNSFIEFPYFAQIFRLILPDFYNTTEVTSVLQAVTQFPTPPVMVKLSTALGWVNFETESWTSVGVYNYQYSCSPNFFLFNGSFYKNLNYFTLTFVLYNLIVSFFILVSYILVSVKVSNENTFCWIRIGKRFKPWKRFVTKSVSFRKKNATRSFENRKVFKRISFIVVTDLICWMPLCIASLIVWHFPIFDTVNTLEEYLEIVIPFQITTLILIPFNSIINPFIYSAHLWKCLFKKFKNKHETAPNA